MDDDNWRRYHPVLLQLYCKPTGHTWKALPSRCRGVAHTDTDTCLCAQASCSPPPFQYSLSRTIQVTFCP